MLSNLDRDQSRRTFSGRNVKFCYDPLIGDPCYRYNKCVKEKFFKNVYLAFLFIQFVKYYGDEFVANKQWRVPSKS